MYYGNHGVTTLCLMLFKELKWDYFMTLSCEIKFYNVDKTRWDM
jgi:hypothetical protein